MKTEKGFQIYLPLHGKQIALFGKLWIMHVDKIVATLPKNPKMVTDTTWN